MLSWMMESPQATGIGYNGKPLNAGATLPRDGELIVQEVVMSPLTSWGNFYLIAGAAAGTLIGLTFVVITLVAQSGQREPDQGITTFTTSTVVHSWCDAPRFRADQRAMARAHATRPAAWLSADLWGERYIVIIMRRQGHPVILLSRA